MKAHNGIKTYERDEVGEIFWNFHAREIGKACDVFFEKRGINGFGLRAQIHRQYRKKKKAK